MNFRRILDTIKSYNFRTVNFRLIVYVIILSVIGINVISSATDDRETMVKQIAGLVGGIFLMVVFMLIRYDFLARYYWLLYFATLFILVIVITPLGYSSMGAQRWVKIGVPLQPSEFGKLLIIIFFAMFIYKNQQTMNSWRFVIFAIALAALPILLILEEPDLSTSIVYFVTICAIMLVSDLHKHYVRVVALIGFALAGIAIALIIILPPDKNILNEYQYNRLVGFYDENNEVAEKIRYQQENSIIAIANGSLTGIGLHNNSVTSVKNAEFVSQPQTDFIFTIVGEELGFVGCMVVVIFLMLVVIECFNIGMRAREQLGRGIAIGVGSWIGFQTFINLGVVTMIIPNTGLTLPFISSGLSSLWVLFMAIGVVLNVGMHRKITF